MSKEAALCRNVIPAERLVITSDHLSEGEKDVVLRATFLERPDGTLLARDGARHVVIAKGEWYSGY